MIRQAVFLVGGRGTRLGSLTQATPKPLLEVAPGLRFLDVLLEDAARQGFTDIVLLAGHLGEQVEALYEGRGVREARIRVVREAAPAGTAGALRQLASQLDPWFLAANGDSLFECNLRALAAAPEQWMLGRLALRHVPDAARFGRVALQDGRVAAFQEKRHGGGAGLINGGVYCLSREILPHLPERGSLETDVFPALARAGLLAGVERQGYFLDIGLPETLAEARRDVPQRRVRPAAFLDRDGVLNLDRGYTHRPEQLAWVAGARQAVLRLNEAGYYVFVVTNQSGIARGLYSEADMARFHAHMQEQLAEIGAHVDAFHHCAYHGDAVEARYRVADHPDRKPNPGMILRAMAEWPVRSDGSFLIGDQDTDVEAARRAGLPGYLLRNESLLSLVESALRTPTAGRDACRASRCG